MKVVHIIKRIEAIDEDIKDLRKLEKSLSKDKSFSTPIYISIEKQINILLDTRIKLLGLTIANPPAELVKEIEGEDTKKESPAKSAKDEKPKKKKSTAGKGKGAGKADKKEDDIDDIGILTQEMVDDKFSKLKEENEGRDKNTISRYSDEDDEDEDEEEDMDDESIKLLDIALENGTLNKGAQEKEKKKVRFFKDNFPGGEY